MQLHFACDFAGAGAGRFAARRAMNWLRSGPGVIIVIGRNNTESQRLVWLTPIASRLSKIPNYSENIFENLVFGATAIELRVFSATISLSVLILFGFSAIGFCNMQLFQEPNFQRFWNRYMLERDIGQMHRNFGFFELLGGNNLYVTSEPPSAVCSQTDLAKD